VAHWVLVISAERYAAERLLSNEALDLTGVEAQRPTDGELVVFVAATEPPVSFGLGRVSGHEAEYTQRVFDAPAPVAELGDPRLCQPGLYPLDTGAFGALAATVRAQSPPSGSANRTWLVSLDLPIEAATPAEAVRTFWTYALRLGPEELPTFVSPADDELAMQAYVLGEPTNLDPEEDD